MSSNILPGVLVFLRFLRRTLAHSFWSPVIQYKTGTYDLDTSLIYICFQKLRHTRNRHAVELLSVNPDYSTQLWCFVAQNTKTRSAPLSSTLFTMRQQHTTHQWEPMKKSHVWFILVRNQSGHSSHNLPMFLIYTYVYKYKIIIVPGRL